MAVVRLAWSRPLSVQRPSFSSTTFGEGVLATLTSSIADGVVVTWMATVCTSLQYGLVTGLPVALGAAAQLGLARMPLGWSQRQLFAAAVLMQTLGLALMAVAPLRGAPVLLMTIGMALYAVGSSVAGLAWQTYTGLMIPEGEQNSFYAKRAVKLCVVSIGTMLLAARYLGERPTGTQVATMLTVALLARGLSVLLILNHPCDLTRHGQMRHLELVPSAPRRAAALFKSPLLVLGLLSLLFRFAVGLCSSFTTTYLMDHRGLNLATLTWLAAVPLVAKMLVTANFGRMMDRGQALLGLGVALLMVAVLPVLWLPSRTIGALVAVQIFAGTGWAGFDLMNLVIIHRLFSRTPAKALGLYLGLGAVGTLLGSLAGGWLLERQILAYPGLFALSTAVRFLAGAGLLALLIKLSSPRRQRHHVPNDASAAASLSVAQVS